MVKTTVIVNTLWYLVAQCQLTFTAILHMLQSSVIGILKTLFFQKAATGPLIGIGDTM